MRFLALLQLAVDDAHQNDDAQISVVPGIDQAGALSGAAASPLGGGRRWTTASRPLRCEAGLGGNRNGAGRIQPDHVSICWRMRSGLGGGQVHLVEIGTIRDPRRSLDGRWPGSAPPPPGWRPPPSSAPSQAPAARTFIGEVHVARRVHQVEGVGLAVPGLVFQAHRLGLMVMRARARCPWNRAPAPSSRAPSARRSSGSAGRPGSICRGRYGPRWRNLRIWARSVMKGGI